MRYVAASLVVLSLAVVVSGQGNPYDRHRSPDKSAPDDFQPYLEGGSSGSPLSPVPDDEFGAVTSEEPAARPLSEGQAPSLREGAEAARDAANLLATAADRFEKGGDQAAQARALQASKLATEASQIVTDNLGRREAQLGSKISRLEQEAARLQEEIVRLKEELRRTQEGKPNGETASGPIAPPM